MAAARRHFDAARGDYAKGAYGQAIAELEAAHALDPNAKDLIFNLGVVHEKLSDIDEALKWFQLYTTMDLTPEERARADAYVKRLEGAKKELHPSRPPTEPEPPPRPAPSASVPPVPDAPAAPPPAAGRVDALTVIAGTVSLASLAVGVVYAVKAVQDKPPSDYVTGISGSYPDLKNQQDAAYQEAVIADVGFGVAALGAVTTAVLYFARRRSPATVTGGAAGISARPLFGGGALIVEGSF
jgi:tetratricopeptide (TPR) repeat protein